MIIDVEPQDLEKPDPLESAIRRALGRDDWWDIDVRHDGVFVDGVWHDAKDPDAWDDFGARAWGELPGPLAPTVLELYEPDLDPTPYEPEAW